MYVENDGICLGCQAVPWGAHKSLNNFKSMLASSRGWMSLSNRTDAFGRSEGYLLVCAIGVRVVVRRWRLSLLAIIHVWMDSQLAR